MYRITALILAIAVFALLAASCSSRSVAPGGGYYSQSHYGYYDYDYYPYYGYNTTSGYYNYLQPPKPAQQVTGLFSTRTVPGTYEDIRWVTETCAKALDPAEYDIDYYLVSLGPEVTNVGAENFSLASMNVTYDGEDDQPNIRMYSHTERVSIAVYHFDDLEQGNTVSWISIDNRSQFYAPKDHGFFLGYRYDEGKEFKWYGPFTNDSSWLLPLAPRMNYGLTNPSLVVATTRGDILDLRSFTVSVLPYQEAYTDWQISRAEYEARMNELERERYQVELDRLRLYEEWQRLEYEYYVLRERERNLERNRTYQHGRRHKDKDRGHDWDYDHGDRHWDDGDAQDADKGRRIDVVETGATVSVRRDLGPPSR